MLIVEVQFKEMCIRDRVEAGFNILRAVGFPVTGPEVITCPTCGRTQYPCTEIANEVEKMCIRDSNYGGRPEIVRAAQQLAAKAAAGEIRPEDINEQMKIGRAHV